MSDETIQDAELRKVVRQTAQRYREKSAEERRILIQQTIEQAMNEELAEQRDEAQRVAAEIHLELTQDSKQRARKQATSIILLLILLLLILWLLAAALGRRDLLPNSSPNSSSENPTELKERLQGATSANPQLAVAQVEEAGQIAAVGSLEAATPSIGERFQAYYDRHGGERVFGRPVSEQRQVNGRTIQWFERARLEVWPEYAGTFYEIQGGRLGTEFTEGISFPTQTYFVSRPGVYYVAETGHGVAEPFLQFWLQHGGVDILGYPISDRVQEILPDQQIHTVQYFERARIEHHPQLVGTPFEIQLGLLGRALYLNESEPNIITPPRPTAVPLP